MDLLTGILMLAAFVALIALIINHSRANTITFMVAIALWLTSATVASMIK